MSLFFEVTVQSNGTYEACCHRLEFFTRAFDLEELHDNILTGIKQRLGEDKVPPMRNVHLLVSRA